MGTRRHDLDPRRAMTAVVLSISVGAALMLGACGATEVARRPSPAMPAGGEQGGAWEAVFPTPSVAFTAGEPRAAAEFARNDERLAVRTAQPLLATAQWPQPDRPTLRGPRYIHLPDDSGTVLWFRTERDVRSRDDRFRSYGY